MNSTPLTRALSIAPDREVAGKARPDREFFCFQLGDLLLGLPSENVREVARLGLLTPLPRMPPFVIGVCGHRGEVLPVLDLLRFFGKGETRPTQRSRLLVGFAHTYTVAVVADSVQGLMSFGLSEILPAPIGGDSSAQFVLGVVKKAEGDQPLSLIDFPKLLQTARDRMVTR